MVSAADWRSPKEIQSIFSIWRNRGKKLRLLVTGTTINHDVYLENYTVDNSRLDTVEYSISFTHAKDIKVFTTAELNIQDTTQVPQTTNDRAASSEAASETPQKTTYTVKPGDNLWTISKKLMGSGARYSELYEANKSIIGSNPNLIYPGQTFTIPG